MLLLLIGNITLSRVIAQRTSKGTKM